MSVGYIYILSNPGMPGLLKIGFTLRDVETRAQELETTGVPYKFTIEYKAIVEDVEDMERYIHAELSQFHVNKEWFKCDVKTCIRTIEHVASGKIHHKESIEDVKSRERLEQQKREKEYAEWRKFEDIKMSISLKHSERVSEKQKELLVKYSDEIARDKDDYTETLYIKWIVFVGILVASMSLFHDATLGRFFEVLLGGLAITFPLFWLLKSALIDSYSYSDLTKMKIEKELQEFSKIDYNRYKNELITALNVNGLSHRDDVKLFISALAKRQL